MNIRRSPRPAALSIVAAACAAIVGRSDPMVVAGAKAEATNGAAGSDGH